MIKPTRLRVQSIAAAGLVALGLVAAATAPASPQFETAFQLKYVTHDPGVSAGFNTLITWSDPGAPGGVPKPIEKFVVDLQRDARIDTRALPACLASDEEVITEGAAACPVASKLGTGHTDAAFASGAAFSTDVTLFNAPNQIIVLVMLHGTTTTVTEFRDQVRGGRITVTPALPPGVSLTRLSLRIPPHSRKVDGKRRSYLTSPSECPAGGEWVSRARFTYVDSSTERLRSSSPCT